MSEAHSTKQPSQSKPAKPYPEYPLTAHPTGRWCKKIRGKIHYFGKWDDPDGALAKYLEQKDALHAGRKPREATDGVVVKEVVNRFLALKQTRVDVGELSSRTWTGYKEACDTIVDAFGKGRLVSDLDADDFTSLRNKLSRKYGPHRLAATIQCIRCVFKFAFECGLIAVPMRFGPGFARPTKKTFRLHKAKQVAKLFTREEIRKLLDAAGVPLKAMLLLGINSGFGNTDCGNLPLTAVNLDSGWIDYPRPKTGIARRCPLWPETVEAMRAALAQRREPKDEENSGLFFVTKYGDGWSKDVADSPITKETRKLLNKLGINGHRNFYALRHTFRTVADEVKDQPAADHLMGHESGHMSSVYRETIGNDRLQAVVNHVRGWLFPTPPVS